MTKSPVRDRHATAIRRSEERAERRLLNVFRFVLGWIVRARIRPPESVVL
jgi:hypothetical protein